MAAKETSGANPNVQLRRERERRNLSQEQLAQKIGTTALNISRWERGSTSPGPHFRQKLIEFFEKSDEELGLTHNENEGIQKQDSSPSPSQEFIFPISNEFVYDSALPSLPTTARLIGRDQLLDDLTQQLHRRKNLAINGLPGAGKTVLVVKLINNRQVLKYFHGGVLWAGLGSEPDIPGLLRRWGGLLGMSTADMEKLSSIEELTKAIRTTIGTRRFLLVADDAWRIEDALAFKMGGPNCVHLVTTRFPEIALQFTEEGNTVIHELNEDEGVMFIAQFAPEAFMQEPDEVRALVQSVGGLPLALTLIGKYLRMQTHSGQHRRLRTALDRLQHVDERLRLAQPRGPADISPGLPPETPLSLQTVISLSDQYLNEEARYALRALSVFPHKLNAFSEEAALAISARSPEVLDALTDAGLLEVSGPERYTLHQIIADYARMHLEDKAVEERMVRFFINYIEVNESDYDALELEMNNVLAALEIASKREMQRDLIRGVKVFYQFLQSRGSYAQAEALLKQAEQAARSLNDKPDPAGGPLDLKKKE